METLLSRASDLIYCKQYIPSSTPVKLVVDYLKKYPRSFLVAADNHKVTGLISRDKLFKKIGPQKDWDMYSKKPISTLLDKNPLILDSNEDLLELYRKVLSRPIETVHDDVVIATNGVFTGLVSVKQLMLCLLEDLRNKLQVFQQQSSMKSPVVATLLTGENGPNAFDSESETGKAFSEYPENDFPEPENVAVPLQREPANHIKLRGHLDTFNIVELVQLLVQGGKTGRLDLLDYQEENPFYTVYIDKGRILHAEGNGITGKAALLKSLKITEGKFVFHYNLQSSKITIHDDPMYFLMEACRIQDEETQIKTAIISN